MVHKYVQFQSKTQFMVTSNLDTRGSDMLGILVQIVKCLINLVTIIKKNECHIIGTGNIFGDLYYFNN